MELTNVFQQVITGKQYCVIQFNGDGYIRFGNSGTGIRCTSGDIYELKLSNYGGNLFARSEKETGSIYYETD